MKTLIAAILTILFFSLSGFALAEEGTPKVSKITGSKLLNMCEENKTTETICTFYIMGVSDGYTTGVSITKDHNDIKGICTPKGVTGTQKRMVVEKYLRAHPEELHHDAILLIVLALTDQWLCPRKAKEPESSKSLLEKFQESLETQEGEE